MAMRSLFLLAIAASAATRAAEQPTADPVLAEASDLAGTVMFVNSGAPGMVLVIVRGDRSLVLGYGETEKGNKQMPDGSSLFRLNSTTKVFATEVLVSLAAEGKLSLTDPLRRYARKMKVPAFGTRPLRRSFQNPAWAFRLRVGRGVAKFQSGCEQFCSDFTLDRA
jgi:serine-type D-Ala-D-Ala carboxypeptidase/endopeptidase